MTAISWKLAAAIALVVIVVAAGVFVLLRRGGGETGDGELPGDNAHAGEVLFKYEASFTYLSSEDNGPIESDLFLVFPCPLIDNEPALTAENLLWQLWGPVEGENGASWLELEVDNGRVFRLVGERTSFSEMFGYSTFINNTSHGAKVWLRFAPWPDNALYQREKALVKAEFAVPLVYENRVTLVDNWSGVYAAYAGYISEGFKEINGEFWVELSKKIDNQFQAVAEHSETEWTLLPNEWCEYRLDSD
jgi:hypothetical protein